MLSSFLQDVDPSEAPVVIWLQGGPGSSSLWGLFEINGPFMAVEDDSGNTIARPNPNSWNKKANMIYIDNPVGTGKCLLKFFHDFKTIYHYFFPGFSHTGVDGFAQNQVDVGNDLYEFLTQWFTLFPEYQVI